MYSRTELILVLCACIFSVLRSVGMVGWFYSDFFAQSRILNLQLGVRAPRRKSCSVSATFRETRCCSNSEQHLCALLLFAVRCSSACRGVCVSLQRPVPSIWQPRECSVMLTLRPWPRGSWEAVALGFVSPDPGLTPGFHSLAASHHLCVTLGKLPRPASESSKQNRAVNTRLSKPWEAARHVVAAAWGRGPGGEQSVLCL